MSECANLFCRNVYRNVSKHNNIALTLCWKTTKNTKHNTCCLTSQLDGQFHNLAEECFWPPICGSPPSRSPENVVPFPFFSKPGEFVI